MSIENLIPAQNKLTLKFENKALEQAFCQSYDSSLRLPLRYGIIISIVSWYCAIPLIYVIIPEHFILLGSFTFLYIGSYFGFIIYATYNLQFQKHYHILGAISNAWAGLYAIYFCGQFPNGVHLTLPVLIFIIFFGSYMIQLRWMAACIAAFSYTIGYHIYIANLSDLSSAQVMLYAFVAWMTLIFAILAGRVSEQKNRVAYIQRKTIREQSQLIEQEKEVLLKEVHHRVKNNLQIIVSLINLQLSKQDDPKVESALFDTQNRILSMSLVHQRMQQTTGFSNILLSDYISQLIGSVASNYKHNRKIFQLQIPDDLTINIENAVPLGLIINEVVTNFYKHCLSANGDANFKIEAKSLKGKLSLIYSDNGPGFPEKVMQDYDTLGLELIESLSDQIDSSFKFHNNSGAVYEIQAI